MWAGSASEINHSMCLRLGSQVVSLYRGKEWAGAAPAAVPRSSYCPSNAVLSYIVTTDN